MVSDSSTDTICDAESGEVYALVYASKAYTKDSPVMLTAGESASVIYTVSGEIPFDAVLSDGQGGTFRPCDLIGGKKDFNLLAFSVCFAPAESE